MVIAAEVQRGMEDSSWIRRMFELGIELRQERGAENVFDLSLGNPITEPPPEFFTELRRFTAGEHPGAHRYMPNPGYVETRQAVADALSDETGLAYGANEIVMTVGAAAGLNVIIHSLCDRGDEVLLLAPYFGEYFFYATNHGATPVVVGCDGDFIPNLAELESRISARTRVVIVNSPNNPSGVMYPASFIEDLARLLDAKSAEFGTEMFLVSDEPYRKILFDGLEYPHIFEHHSRSIVATSHSKDLALPGERIGFIAANPEYSDKEELIDGLTFCNRTLGFVNAPALMQYIVKNLQSVTVDVAKYGGQRDFVHDALTDIGYEVVKPQGAFYMFPKAPIDDDVEFTGMLRENRVLVVPGSGFGGPGHFRISYCVTDATLEGSLPGFRAAFEAAG